MTTPIQIIKQYAPQFGLDPSAVVAYALTQGGTSWGAVGDHGTSFGPFQAHIGGAAGRRTPQAASQWANSAEGLTAMMRMMSQAGARGRSGPDAAAYIVGPSFGRGANPTRDMANARAAYGRAAQLVGGATASTAPAPPAAPFPHGNAPSVPATVATDPAARMALIQQIQKIGQKGGGFSVNPVLDLLRAQAAPPAVAQAPAAATPPSGGGGTPTKPGQVEAPLIQLSKMFGLTVTSGYRSYAKQAELYAHRSTQGSVAAPGKSYHNSGRAIDVAVSPSAMKFLAYAKGHPERFREVFYDPAGWYIKNGRIVHGSIGGHSDHVHIAI